MHGVLRRKIIENFLLAALLMRDTSTPEVYALDFKEP
jgi:hypothetical protein